MDDKKRKYWTGHMLAPRMVFGSGPYETKVMIESLSPPAQVGEHTVQQAQFDEFVVRSNTPNFTEVRKQVRMVYAKGGDRDPEYEAYAHRLMAYILDNIDDLDEDDYNKFRLELQRDYCKRKTKRDKRTVYDNKGFADLGRQKEWDNYRDNFRDAMDRHLAYLFEWGGPLWELDEDE